MGGLEGAPDRPLGPVRRGRTGPGSHTLPTYLGARAFPGVLLGFGLRRLMRGERPVLAGLARIGLMAGLALAVATPLGLFFLTHPGTLSPRMGQVFIFRSEVNGGDPWGLFLANVEKLLGAFISQGESLWRYNIPGRPVFVGPTALALVMGLAVTLGRLVRGDPASALVLSWLGAMTLPCLLSWDAGVYTLRAMGLVPALGPDTVWGWLSTRLPGRHWVAALAVGLVLVGDGVWTARDYFWVWAPSSGAYAEGHADAVAQARFLARSARPDAEEVFVSSDYYHHPTLAQLAGQVYPFPRWFDGRRSVVFPLGAGRPAFYVLAFSALPTDVDQLFPPSARVGAAYFPQDIDGVPPPPLFLAYRLTPADPEEAVSGLSLRLNRLSGCQIADLVEVVGAQVPAVVVPGGELPVGVLWRVNRRPEAGSYQMLVHLTGRNWAGGCRGGHPGLSAVGVAAGRCGLEPVQPADSGRDAPGLVPASDDPSPASAGEALGDGGRKCRALGRTRALEFSEFAAEGGSGLSSADPATPCGRGEAIGGAEEPEPVPHSGGTAMALTP